MSHEIRTPLTVLAGFVETMTQLPLKRTPAAMLVLMTAQAQRMVALVARPADPTQLEGSPRPPTDHRWLAVNN